MIAEPFNRSSVVVENEQQSNKYHHDATMNQIRGKRKHRHVSKSSQNKRRQGRPLQEDSRPLQKSVALLKLQKHHSAKSRKMAEEFSKLSTLEKLPVELIQQIFFYALEVNMPRASTHLRQVLSTDAIFNALVLLAYFDDDGESPVETKHFLPGEYRILTCSEKIWLQKSVFSCRWCTYDHIVGCLPALSRLAMVQASHREQLLDESHDPGSTAQNTEFIVANDTIREFANLPSLMDEAGLEQHFLARTRIEDLGNSESLMRSLRHTNPTYLPRIVTWRSSSDDNGGIHKSTDKSVSVLAARHIPSRILVGGPLSGDRLALLQLLRQGYTFIQDDHVMSISATAVFDGMRAAIQDVNVVGLKTLLELHCVLFKSGAWTFQNMMSSVLTPPTHHPLPLDLFHQVARLETDSSELMSLLVRTGIDALPRDDEVVTAWAIYKSQQDDALAIWLLKHMEGNASYGLPRRGHLFVDGCLSWRARARGAFPFPETSFATELGYLAGTPVVPAGLDGKPCGTDEDTE